MEISWKVLVSLMMINAVVVFGFMWFQKDIDVKVVKYQSVQIKCILSEIHKNMTKNLIILRQQVLNDIKQCVFHPNIYSNFSRRKIYDSNVDKYLEDVKVIEPIKTVSATCTVYPHIKRKNPDLPYCGPTFTYYRYGVDRSQCSSKHPLLTFLDFCLDRDNPSVTQVVERHLANDVDTKATLFVHVIPYGKVDNLGNVKVGNVIISPKSCYDNKNFINSINFKHVDEVFVISQFWGDGFFHAMIENLPRISLYIEFIKTFVNITVHVGGPQQYIKNTLNALGIEENRLVYGPVMADVVYLPRGGGCGSIRQPEGHLLAQQYHNYTQKFLRSSKQKDISAVVNSTVTSGGTDMASSGTNTASSGTNTRQNIVLLRRNRRRRWLNDNQHKQIEQHLIELSNKHSFHYKRFDAIDFPSFNDTVALFYNAALIVGAHGAGLSNVIFAQPEAYVIELMCKQEPNLCYGYLSEKQGLHHYILASTGGGCAGMSFNITRVNQVIDYFMERILEKEIVK